MLDERAFVIRGNDGELRAFHNVCRHRAHALVSGTGGSCARAITCPYHSWTYDFDGGLKALPHADSFGDPSGSFDRSRFGLRELDLEIYLGFVFIRFRSEGPSVASRLAPYTEELSHYGFEGYRSLDDVFTHPEPINWKNAMDNYLEDYHFATGHPGLSALMEPDYDRELSPTGASRLSHRMKQRPQKSWSVRHYRKLLQHPQPSKSSLTICFRPALIRLRDFSDAECWRRDRASLMT